MTWLAGSEIRHAIVIDIIPFGDQAQKLLVSGILALNPAAGVHLRQGQTGHYKHIASDAASEISFFFTMAFFLCKS